ncbi:MAG: alpha/beta hydrolase [Alphaproteobacteria bacterium]|nr:alpha/beta hydrolase [Alphaproteobacteria bacterium]
MMKKTPLILLPGLLCDKTLWQHQITTLNDMAEIFVADLTRDNSMEDMAKRILDDAPEKFALAGMSMGGYLALEIIRQAPKRVLKLALLNTTAAPDTPEKKAMRIGHIKHAQSDKFCAMTKSFLKSLLHKSRLDDKELCEIITEMTSKMGAEVYINQQEAILGRTDNRPFINIIECPTLIICGKQDEATPLVLHEEMHREIPNSKLVIIDECGHMSPIERPHAVSAAIQYWLQDN